MRLNELLRFDDIVIQCHDYPDADSIATGFALLTYLRDNGKSPRLIYSSEKEITKPSLLIMIEKLGIPLEHVLKLNEPELLVTVDCVYSERNVTHLPAKNYASIDHHKVTTETNDLVEVRSNYGSCSAVIAEMLHAEGLNVNDHLDVATALYYGLYMDTNAFSEIYHPADKDLRDSAIYDMQLMQLLKNSNLSLDELAIAGEAVKNVYYDAKHKFALTEAMPCDPNILGIISDLLIQAANVEVCIVCSKVYGHGIKFSVRSFTKDMRADELAKIIAEDAGNGGGHAVKAGGFIRFNALTDKNVVDFLVKRVVSAYESYKTFYADALDMSKLSLGRYKRLPQTLGCIRSTDILPAGGKFSVRTLKADFNIISDDNTYILVKDSGSIRTIDKSKFEKVFIATDEPFTFSSTPEYPPHVMNADSGDDYAVTGNIMRLAKKCYNNDANVYLAHKLTENIKLYKSSVSEDYTIGHIDDYLVISNRETDSIFIVPHKQFEKEYGIYE